MTCPKRRRATLAFASPRCRSSGARERERADSGFSRCAVRPAQQADQTLPAEAPDRREEQREAASPASIRSACGSQMHFAGWRRLVGLQARHRGEALLLARQGLLSARANRQGYKPDVAPFVVSSSIGHVRLAVLSRRVRYALFWFADFWWFLLRSSLPGPLIWWI